VTEKKDDDITSLTLYLKKGEYVTIGGNVKLKVQNCHRNDCASRVIIKAPRCVGIMRETSVKKS